MAGQDYNPTGASFPTWPLTLVKDGEVYNFDTIMQSGDPKRGLFSKLMDAVEALRTGTAVIQIASYNGVIWQIAAGSLVTFLRALADKAAKVDNANFWTAAQSFNVRTTHAAITVAAPIQQSYSDVPNAATYLIDPSLSAAWGCNSISQQIDISIQDLNSNNGDIIYISRVAAGAFAVVIHREGQASAIVTLPASTATGAILIRRGLNWRLLVPGAGATPGAHA